VNGCACKGACKTAANDCKGKNSCKGKGWLDMLNTECADQDACGRGRLSMAAAKPPFLGFGLGLRPQHYAEILAGSPAIDWFEIISENDMIEGGQPLRMLDQICERTATMRFWRRLRTAPRKSGRFCSTSTVMLMSPGSRKCSPITTSSSMPTSAMRALRSW